jgi:hypothetical protein
MSETMPHISDMIGAASESVNFAARVVVIYAPHKKAQLLKCAI